jgi:hypothetical protein
LERIGAGLVLIAVAASAVVALVHSAAFWVVVAAGAIAAPVIYRRRRADRELADAMRRAIAVRQQRDRREQIQSRARFWPEGLTWSELEELTADLLRRDGWVAQVTSSGSDRGIDVLASAGGLVLCAQCKQLAAPVGGPEIHRFVGALASARAHRGLFVSPSGFTIPARVEAAVHPSLQLVDRDQLLSWMDAGWQLSPPDQ